MSKPVILTGIRANNDLHLGNYFGALLPIISLAKEKAGDYQINLFVPDLHSFTTPIDHDQLYQGIMSSLKTFVAAGLPIDSSDVYIYRQSYIPAHSELTWILDCFTGMGEMQRMTQFKDKSNDLGADRISVGLFNYPVLMAADILLYGAKYVPVGEDQSQHLEFTRDIAERMNNQFGNIFQLPEPVKLQHALVGKDQGLRIKDLQDPTKKMSKSEASGKGAIFLNEDPAEARKKILSATTDSLGHITYDKQNQPGIANLLELLALVSGRELSEVISTYEGQSQYGPLKQELATKVSDLLESFQEKRMNVDENKLLSKLSQSEELMNLQAQETLFKVQQAVGLRK
ncbi:MAG TPA: tryptophan--tRNA ligase [Candidatus Saccharimonadales bacterium]|nr:tryptophan--tRNA ligase [Candidatus Saccharimonadales bacterium]